MGDHRPNSFPMSHTAQSLLFLTTSQKRTFCSLEASSCDKKRVMFSTGGTAPHHSLRDMFLDERWSGVEYHNFAFFINITITVLFHHDHYYYYWDVYVRCHCFEPRIKFYEIRYFYASAFRCQRHYFSGCPSVRTSVGLINHYPGDRPTEQPGKTKTPDQAQRRLTNCAIWYADVSWPTPGLIRFWSWFAELKKKIT